MGIADRDLVVEEVVAQLGADGDQGVHFGGAERIDAVDFVGGEGVLDLNEAGCLQTLEIVHGRPFSLGTRGGMRGGRGVVEF